MNEPKEKDEYFKMKKGAAVGLFVGLGVVLAALMAFVVMDTLKIRDIEAKIDTVGDLTQARGGKMGNFERGTMPSGEVPELPEDFDGEMPGGGASGSNETPELPEDKKPDTSKKSGDA